MATLAAIPVASDQRLAVGSQQPEVALVELAYLKSQELWKSFKDHELEEEFDKLVGQIKKRQISARLMSLEYDIKTAEKDKDKKRLSALLEEFSKISGQLNG